MWSALRTLAVLLVALGLGAGSASGQARGEGAAGPPLAGGWEGEVATSGWPLFLWVQLAPGEGGQAGKLYMLGQTIDLQRTAASDGGFALASGPEADALTLKGEVKDGALIGRLSQGADIGAFSLRPIPVLPKPKDRIEAWAQDLDALDSRFLALDRSFSPAQRALFREATARVRKELPTLSDPQVIIGMASALALSGNPHTRLYLLRNRTELRRMPIRLWWFSDGLYVVRTTAEYRHLLGCRIEDVAGVGSRQARDIVGKAFAGGPGWTDYMSVYSLTSPEMLNGFGVTATPDSVNYGVTCAGKASRAVVAALALAKTREVTEAWWDLSPLGASTANGWRQALAERGRKPPLYLQDPTRYYWHRFDPATGVFSFQYNRAADMKDQDVATYAKALLAEFDRRPVKAFVLDLRLNTGGNSNLAAELMERLRARTKGMPRFVIVGRTTFSGGIAHAAVWRQDREVVFVGEGVGDELDFWSEGGNIVLPNSGLAAHFANGAHSYSPRPCPDGLYCVNMSVPDLRPDIAATPTWAEYISGRDVAMEAVAARLKAERGP